MIGRLLFQIRRAGGVAGRVVHWVGLLAARGAARLLGVRVVAVHVVRPVAAGLTLGCEARRAGAVRVPAPRRPEE